MVGELIMLPLRITGAVARAWWRTTEQAIGLASEVVEHAVERVSGDGSDQPDLDYRGPDHGSTWPSREAARSRPEAPRRAPTVERHPAPPRRSAPVVPEQETPHVSEEPTLVESQAEPGAEDGAGAQVRVEEPWEGYRNMKTRDVTARLAQASAAELAAVQLYETSHRRRQTILAAVAKRSRSVNGSISRP